MQSCAELLLVWTSWYPSYTRMYGAQEQEVLSGMLVRVELLVSGLVLQTLSPNLKLCAGQRTTFSATTRASSSLYMYCVCHGTIGKANCTY